MLILHTSDWYLGQNFMGKSRVEEHSTSLNGLLKIIKEKKIQVLLVSGDIFDTGTPPNYALELYYNFLKKLSNINTIIKKHNTLQNELSSLKSKDESLSTQISNLDEKQSKDTNTLEELNQKFEKELAVYNFTSKEEFEKALLDKEQFETLSSFCKNIEDKYTQTQTLKTDTTNKLQEQKELNLSVRKLDEVNEELNSISSSIDELQKAIGSLEKELEINAQNIKKAEDKIKSLKRKKSLLKYG